MGSNCLVLFAQTTNGACRLGQAQMPGKVICVTKFLSYFPNTLLSTIFSIYFTIWKKTQIFLQLGTLNAWHLTLRDRHQCKPCPTNSLLLQKGKSVCSCGLGKAAQNGQHKPSGVFLQTQIPHGGRGG